ncbi:MAG: hypothetical protein HQL14_04640 [Candidatus Omnitrophica bacterium]|nr:hypothetical protein [Candidatus Omnitrophota bacterium]
MSNYIKGLLAIGAMVALVTTLSWAKGGDARGQIILLNDSAAALEESNPQMARDLAQFADEKEKALEDANVGKDEPQESEARDIQKLKTKRTKLLRDTAQILKPTYPEIAKGLMKMADESDK